MNVLAATIPNPGGGPRARLKTGTQAPRKTRRRRATPASSPISPITNGRPRPARLKGTVPFRFGRRPNGAAGVATKPEGDCPLYLRLRAAPAHRRLGADGLHRRARVVADVLR